MDIHIHNAIDADFDSIVCLNEAQEGHTHGPEAVDGVGSLRGMA